MEILNLRHDGLSITECNSDRIEIREPTIEKEIIYNENMSYSDTECSFRISLGTWLS